MSQISNLANVVLPASGSGHDQPARRHAADKTSYDRDDDMRLDQDQPVADDRSDSADKHVRDRQDDGRDVKHDGTDNARKGDRADCAEGRTDKAYSRKDTRNESRPEKVDDDQVVQADSVEAAVVEGSFAAIIQNLIDLKENLKDSQTAASGNVVGEVQRSALQLLEDMASQFAKAVVPQTTQNVGQDAAQKAVLELIQNPQQDKAAAEALKTDAKMAEMFGQQIKQDLSKAEVVDPKQVAEQSKFTEMAKGETADPMAKVDAKTANGQIAQNVQLQPKDQAGQIQVKADADSPKPLTEPALKDVVKADSDVPQKVTAAVKPETSNTQAKPALQHKQPEVQESPVRASQPNVDAVAAKQVQPAIADNQTAKGGDFQAQMASQFAQQASTASAQNVGQGAVKAAQDVHASPASQLGDALGARIVRAGDQITVRLDPPELGQIKLTIHAQGGQVRAVLEVSNPSVLHELKRDASHVLGTLADSGVHMQKLDVRLNDQSSTSQQQQQFDQQRQAGQDNPAGQGPRQHNDRQPENRLYSKQGEEQAQTANVGLPGENTINVVI